MHEKSNIEIDIDIIRDNFGEALKRVWAGDAEDDGFNSLVVRAGLSWNEVVIFRAIAKYLRQVGAPFSQAYMEETLCKHADVTSMLTHYFISKFDRNYLIYEIIFNGTPNLFLKLMSENNEEFDTQNKIWKLK